MAINVYRTCYVLLQLLVLKHSRGFTARHSIIHHSRISSSRRGGDGSAPSVPSSRQTKTTATSATMPVLLEIPSTSDSDNQRVGKDNRPFAQRVTGPRPARRLNHAFRYLHRHDQELSSSNDANKNMSSFDFLTNVVGYSIDEVHTMNATFPPLLELDVPRHMYPKLRFMTTTLGVPDLAQVRKSVPPQYFGSRLERIVAPRHAFLVHHDIRPHGRDLVLDADKWRDFLLACRKPKQFCAMCNQWKRDAKNDERGAMNEVSDSPVVIRQIEGFDVLFQRGLMAATRNELCQANTAWPLEVINVTSAEMMQLLVSHGANPLEKDARGCSLLHWAAGTGNLDNLKVLLPYFKSDGIWEEIERDGALSLHWAAAGADAREFGTGGHVDVCRYLLDQVEAGDERKRLVNQPTKDGNSALMWSSWAASLDVVKLLVRSRADPLVANRNGCTVAHWAASGGNLECCRYLYETVGVDFSQPNHGGNTPLTHAVAFGRADVVNWLRSEVLIDEDDTMAATLARDFVDWTGGDDKRKEVLSLFQDFYGGGQGTEVTTDVDQTAQIDDELF